MQALLEEMVVSIVSTPSPHGGSWTVMLREVGQCDWDA